MKSIWSILGIEPTKDEKTIKRAYAKRMKEIDRNNVEEFQALKDAFDLARKLSAGEAINDYVATHEKRTESKETVNEQINRKSVNPFKHNTIREYEFEDLLYNENKAHIDAFFNRFRTVSLDVEIEVTHKLIYLVGTNLSRVSQYLVDQTLEHLQYSNSEEDDSYLIDRMKNFYQYRTFKHIDHPLFLDYIAYREEIIQCIVNHDYLQAKYYLENPIIGAQLWKDELEQLTILVKVLLGKQEERQSLYQQCKTLLKADPHNVIISACFFYLLQQHNAGVKLVNSDYIKNGMLIVDYKPLVEIPFQDILRNELFYRTTISVAVQDYLNIGTRGEFKPKPKQPQSKLLSFMMYVGLVCLLILMAIIATSSESNRDKQSNTNQNTVSTAELEELFFGDTYFSFDFNNPNIESMPEDIRMRIGLTNEIIHNYINLDPTNFRNYMKDKDLEQWVDGFYNNGIQFDSQNLTAFYAMANLETVFNKLVYVDQNDMCVQFYQELEVGENKEIKIVETISFIPSCKRSNK